MEQSVKVRYIVEKSGSGADVKRDVDLIRGSVAETTQSLRAFDDAQNKLTRTPVWKQQAQESRLAASAMGDVTKEVSRAAAAYDSLRDRAAKALSAARAPSGSTGSGFASTITNQVQSLSESGISSAAGLLGPALGSVVGPATQLVSALGPVGVAGTAVAAGLGFATKAAFDIIRPFGEAAEQTLNMSAALQLTPRQFQLVDYAAQRSGVNIGVFQNGVLRIDTALTDLDGTGKKAASGIASLGIALTDTNGNLRSSGDIFLEVLSSLSQIPDKSERSLIAQQILGRQGAKEISKLVDSYKEGIAAAEQLGVKSDEQLQAFARADDAIGDMEKAWSNFKAALAAPIAPIVINLAGTAARLLTGNIGQPNTGTPFRSNALENQLKPAANIGVPSAISSFVANRLPETVAANKFTEKLKATERGRQKSLQSLISSRAELESKLSQETLSLTSRATLEAERKTIEAQIAGIEASLKNSGGKGGGSGLQKRNADKTKEYFQQRQQLIRREEDRQLDELERFDRATNETIVSPAFQADAQGRDIAAFIALRDPERKKLLQEVGERLPLGIRAVTEAVNDSINAAILDQVKAAGEAGLKAVKEANEARDAQLKASAQRQFSDPLAEQRARIEADRARLSITSEQRATVAGIQVDKVITENLNARLVAAEEQKIRLNAIMSADEQAYQIQLLRARTKLDQEQLAIDFDRRILDAQAQRAAKFEQSALATVDSLARNGGNPLNLVRTAGQQYIRQVSANALTGIFSSASGPLGQLGSRLPGVLTKNTILDPESARLAQAAKQIQASDRNTRAIEANTRALTGGAGSVLAGPLGTLNGLGSIISDGNGITGQGGILQQLGSPRSSSSTTNSKLGNVFGGLTLQGGLFAGLRGTDYSVIKDGVSTSASSLGLTSKASRAANIAGSAGAIAGGVFGAISGFKQGGIGGGLTAAGSILGTIALIPGPQQPFVAVGAAIAGGLASLFGKDSREKRLREEAQFLDSRRFTAPEGRNGTFGPQGEGFAADKYGRPTIQITVSTLDAKSFMENRSMVADAVRGAIADGHDLSRDVAALTTP
jgi:hypothetical protein